MGQPLDLSAALTGCDGRFVLTLSTASLRSFSLALGNAAGDQLRIGYDAAAQLWWLDRSQSGDVGFHPVFTQRAVAPRLAAGMASDLQLWFDATSVELLADGGLSVLTALFFPSAPWQHATLASDAGLVLGSLTLQALRPPA